MRLQESCDHSQFAIEGLVAELAEALYGLGRYAEAEEASLESERLAQPTDAASQGMWRGVRGWRVERRGIG